MDDDPPSSTGRSDGSATGDAAGTPAERLVATLERTGGRIAVAEAHTGGAVCARLVAVPGASRALDRGWIVYGRDAPRTELGVSREVLDESGAVSAPVAEEMARRARDRADAAWGVATTGIAGPSGGTDAKPVGTVYVAVARAAPWESNDSFARSTRYAFEGDRQAVVAASARRALRDALDAVESDGERDSDGGAADADPDDRR